MKTVEIFVIVAAACQLAWSLALFSPVFKKWAVWGRHGGPMSLPGKCCILIYAACVFVCAAIPGFGLAGLGAMILGLAAVCAANVYFQIDRKNNNVVRIVQPEAHIYE
jgi:hypothetical protein